MWGLRGGVTSRARRKGYGETLLTINTQSPTNGQRGQPDSRHPGWAPRKELISVTNRSVVLAFEGLLIG